MKAIVSTWMGGLLSILLCLGESACSPESGPQTGSQTNWLRACQTNAECGDLACLCGTCTRSCDGGESACATLEGASCSNDGDLGAIALCGGQLPASRMCMLPCPTEGCGDGRACVAGVCSPVTSRPSAVVAVSTSVRYQRLTGLGATYAYIESGVAVSFYRNALLQAMFPDLGLDLLRLRNRFGLVGDDDLSTSADIVREATARLGRRPMLLMSSWSPPANLKASGSTTCRGDADTCTLAKTAGGTFDYAAFGTHWRASLDAYAAVGIVPDYIGIQNNPDFVPSADAPGEGCRFLPTEGPATVSVNGADVVVAYPGFAQAMSATVDKLAGLAAPPKIVAPEASDYRTVAAYAAYLDFARIDAIGYHLYGTDPAAVDVSAMEGLRKIGVDRNRPLFQTEMDSDGLGTARLIHYALVIEQATAYLQNALVAPVSSAKRQAGPLIAFQDDTSFTLEDSYHALRHYALHTDPDWTRVDAASDADSLLASAWLAPGDDALTVILLNSGVESLDVKLELAQWATASSSVVRTVFDGIERSNELGALPSEGVLRVPAHGLVTLALHR